MKSPIRKEQAEYLSGHLVWIGMFTYAMCLVAPPLKVIRAFSIITACLFAVPLMMSWLSDDDDAT